MNSLEYRKRQFLPEKLIWQEVSSQVDDVVSDTALQKVEFYLGTRLSAWVYNVSCAG